MTYTQVLMHKKAADEDQAKKAKNKPADEDQAKNKPAQKSNYRRTGNQYGQSLGRLTSGLAITGISSLLGGIMGGRRGAAAGAIAGTGISGAATAVASLVGRLRRARTAEQQAQIDNNTNRTLLQYLVPGVAQYDRASRQEFIKAHTAKQAQNSKNYS